MGSFLEWYLEVPVVTRFYMTSSVLTTAACSLELLSPFSLYFNFHLVFMKLQRGIRSLERFVPKVQGREAEVREGVGGGDRLRLCRASRDAGSPFGTGR